MEEKIPKIRSERVETVLHIVKLSGTISLKALDYYVTQLGRPRYDPNVFRPTVSWRSTAYYLKSRGDLFLEKKEKEVWASLTKQGDKRLEMLINQSVSPPDTSKWDGKWRFVMFDIPETERKLRRAFRCQLKQLHYTKLQRSVWITPYDTKKQIKQLCEIGKFDSRSVRFANVEAFDGEQQLMKKFKISRN